MAVNWAIVNAWGDLKIAAALLTLVKIATLICCLVFGLEICAQHGRWEVITSVIAATVFLMGLAIYVAQQMYHTLDAQLKSIIDNGTIDQSEIKMWGAINAAFNAVLLCGLGVLYIQLYCPCAEGSFQPDRWVMFVAAVHFGLLHMVVSIIGFIDRELRLIQSRAADGDTGGVTEV